MLMHACQLAGDHWASIFRRSPIKVTCIAQHAAISWDVCPSLTPRCTADLNSSLKAAMLAWWWLVLIVVGGLLLITSLCCWWCIRRYRRRKQAAAATAALHAKVAEPTQHGSVRPGQPVTITAYADSPNSVRTAYPGAQHTLRTAYTPGVATDAAHTVNPYYASPVPQPPYSSPSSKLNYSYPGHKPM